MSISILVATPCVSEKTRSTLEFFFQSHCQNRFQLTSAIDADMFIVDLDAVNGQQTLEELLKKSRFQPVVALTVHDVNIDGVQIMRKPIQLDVLKKAFTFYYEELQRKKHQVRPETAAQPVEALPVVQKPVKAKPAVNKQQPVVDVKSAIKKLPLDIDLTHIESEPLKPDSGSQRKIEKQVRQPDSPAETRQSKISSLFGGYVDAVTSQVSIELPEKPVVKEPPQQLETPKRSIQPQQPEVEQGKAPDKQVVNRQESVLPDRGGDQSQADSPDQDELKETQITVQENAVPEVTPVETSPANSATARPIQDQERPAEELVKESEPEIAEQVPTKLASGETEPESKPAIEEMPQEKIETSSEQTAEQASEVERDDGAELESLSFSSSKNQSPGSSAQFVGEYASAVQQCCGNRQDVDPAMPEEREQLFYKIGNSLQAYVQYAFQLATERNMPVSVVLESDKNIVIAPGKRRVLSNIKEQILRARTHLPIDQSKILVEVHETIDESVFFERDYPQDEPLEAFLWKIALWTSYGRVVKGTDLDARVTLKQWPNFTRVIAIPQFMRIASYWSKNGASLLETAEALAMPQRYVFSFFSACQALQLVEVASNTEVKPEPSPVVQLGATKRRGIFSRLINHLRNSA